MLARRRSSELAGGGGVLVVEPDLENKDPAELLSSPVQSIDDHGVWAGFEFKGVSARLLWTSLKETFKLI